MISTTRLLMRILLACHGKPSKIAVPIMLRELADRIEKGEEAPKVKLVDWGMRTIWEVEAGERSG